MRTAVTVNSHDERGNLGWMGPLLATRPMRASSRAAAPPPAIALPLSDNSGRPRRARGASHCRRRGTVAELAGIRWLRLCRVTQSSPHDQPGLKCPRTFVRETLWSAPPIARRCRGRCVTLALYATMSRHRGSLRCPGLGSVTDASRRAISIPRLSMMPSPPPGARRSLSRRRLGICIPAAARDHISIHFSKEMI